jgi:hypothetical protein
MCHSTFRRVPLKRSAVFIFLLLLIAGQVLFSGLQRQERFGDETRGFYELSKVASEMIEKDEAGVVTNGMQKYISSFDDFFNYVARTQPRTVSTRTAENPFPGFLPAGTYTRADSHLSSSNDVLIMSQLIYRRDRRRTALTAEGLVTGR